ncbi:MAG: F0F1 ATP synthase subunit B [Chloroflexota bacterium]
MEGIGINLPLLVAFLVNFLLLFGLLGYLLYKPILKTLDERAARIREGLESAERMKEQAIKAEQEVKAQIEAGRKEGQAIVAQAAQAGDRIKTEAKEEARKEAEAVISRARAEIQHERDQTVDQLRKEFVDIAILAAEKVIKETLDKEKHRKVIEDVLEKSPKLKG